MHNYIRILNVCETGCHDTQSRVRDESWLGPLQWQDDGSADVQRIGRPFPTALFSTRLVLDDNTIGTRHETNTCASTEHAEATLAAHTHTTNALCSRHHLDIKP
jgi:hypothetical protein